jgi:hypothetical protein
LTSAASWPKHPDTAESIYQLAIVQEREGKRVEALQLLREVIDHGFSLKDVLAWKKIQISNHSMAIRALMRLSHMQN